MSDKNFRLSRTVRPERYRFRVTPDLAAGTFTGEGSVEITVDREAPELVLHGIHIDVAEAKIDGATARATSEAVSQTLTFSTGEPIAAGRVTLAVKWSGAFQKDLRGLYLAGGVGVTQFEAADARRVFPCFDEPPFKAVWEIEVACDAGLTVVGNGPVAGESVEGGKRIVRFAPTPKLSSYLVALVVGKLVASPAAAARGIPIRTFTTPDKTHLTAFAQDCAASVLPLLEDYFDHPYVFGKLDQIGVPDFEAGAMENAGCITYREIALLVDPAKASLAAQKRVAEVITHELAHQWFGNLVTMEWWNDLWLNEAFATWMAYKIVDQWKPGWRMWDDFEGGKAAALHLDAMESTHPIHVAVANADEATENFDLITYEKGGAMLRMIEGYLGAGPFRDGIRAYMKKFAYANTVADDLWRSLAQASGHPIEEVANGWIGRGGFPLVEIARTGDRVKLTQRRFWADPEKIKGDAEAPWLVPVVLAWADDAGEHETRVLLREHEAELTLGAQGPVEWLCGNKSGAGFYRVKYAPAELARLAAHGPSLTPVERVNLIADAWALFRAGVAPLAPLLDLLAAFALDEDYTVVGEVVSRLDGLERRFAAAGDVPRLRALVEKLFAPQHHELGWEPAAGESDERKLRRAAVVRAMTLVGREGASIVEATLRSWRSLSGEARALDANLLDVAYVAAARPGDGAMFDSLVERLGSDPNPASRRRILVALASFEAPALAARSIDLLLSDTVPMQDVTTYAATLLGNRAARDRAWDHIRAEWPRVHAKSAAPMLTRRMVESMGELLDKRAEVEAFFDAQAASLAAAPQAVKQTRERMRLDEEVRRRASVELAGWLAARGE